VHVHGVGLSWGTPLRAGASSEQQPQKSEAANFRGNYPKNEFGFW
jgi:hypothetical protein